MNELTMETKSVDSERVSLQQQTTFYRKFVKIFHLIITSASVHLGATHSPSTLAELAAG